MKNDFDEFGFKDLVVRNWCYHRTCRHQMWSATKMDDGVMKLSIAPIYQEILGGEDDGKLVWASFSMRLTELFADPHLEVHELGFRSYCEKNTPNPLIEIRGNYKSRLFNLTIHLEPQLDTDPIEIIDTIRNQTRAIRSIRE